MNVNRKRKREKKTFKHTQHFPIFILEFGWNVVYFLFLTLRFVHFEMFATTSNNNISEYFYQFLLDSFVFISSDILFKCTTDFCNRYTVGVQQNQHWNIASACCHIARNGIEQAHDAKKAVCCCRKLCDVWMLLQTNKTLLFFRKRMREWMNKSATVIRMLGDRRILNLAKQIVWR